MRERGLEPPRLAALEPKSSASANFAIPAYMVTHPRFELGTPWLKVKCSADWANGSNGWGNRTRTCGMQESKSCALPTWLYPNMVDESGFEPLKAKLTDLQSVPFGQLGYSSILKTLVKINGAGDRTWTHNLLITNQLLYRLSYTSVNIKWRPGTDSNRRPPAWQAGILTNWTTGPCVRILFSFYL